MATLLAGTSATCTGITQLRFGGDFSAYKGNIVARKITAAANDFNYGYIFARFEAATSMGDVTAERDDAVVLRRRSHLYIAPAVAQSAARGINCARL